MTILIRFENEVYDLSINGLRKLLHDAVESHIDELELEYSDFIFEEIDQIHELISSQDINSLIDDFWLDGDIYFSEVEQTDLLVEALIAAGYKVEKSNVSRSIYAINDNGEEVRISDHKRPAIEQNGIWSDIEYENEIIVSDNIVYLRQLHVNGFFKLNKNEYLLG